MTPNVLKIVKHMLKILNFYVCLTILLTLAVIRIGFVLNEPDSAIINLFQFDEVSMSYLFDLMSSPNLDLLCVWHSDAAPFAKIMQSFILMQNTLKRD